MADTVSRVAVVDPSGIHIPSLRKMIQGMDWVVMEIECPRLDMVKDAFANAGKLDGAIVVLDDDPQHTIALIGELLALYPRLSIIAVSERSDLLVQAHRRGARSLLEHPVQLEDLSVALKNLAAGISLQRPPKGQVVAILSSRGGVGSTSLAVNLGATLAATPQNQVVLIDLDLTAGAADIALDIVPERCLTDVAPNIDDMDFLSLRKSLSLDETGLLLLARPTHLRDIAQINPEQVQRMITLLRIASSHVILDLSKAWNANDLLAMHASNLILLVIQPELTSVRNATTMLSALAEEGLEERIRLVLNRVGADFGGGAITLKRVEEVLIRPIYWQLPNEEKVMGGAWTAGSPLIQFAPKSKVQQSIAALAADLGVRDRRRPG